MIPFNAKRAISMFTRPPADVFKLDKNLLPKEAETNKEELLKYYHDMLLQRRFEIRCNEAYKAGAIRGFCHLMEGQEGVSVGILQGVTPADHIITAYRYHGLLVGRETPPDQVYAELFGRRTGVSKGKGGSMHMTNRKNRFYGGHGIVGAQVSIGTGIAFGINYTEKKEVCVTMFGDGAINQGQVAESANMAKLWNLPIIYVCENNLYGMGTPVERASANKDLYTRLDPIPGFRIEGQNVFCVRESMRFARKWCLEGKGPIFIEMMTYRYHGHSMSDPGLSYRTRNEIEKMRKERDPVGNLKKIILDNGFATEEELKKIDKEKRKQMEEAAEKALKEPMPEPDKDLFTYIYGTASEESNFVESVTK